MKQNTSRVFQASTSALCGQTKPAVEREREASWLALTAHKWLALAAHKWLQTGNIGSTAVLTFAVIFVELNTSTTSEEN